MKDLPCKKKKNPLDVGTIPRETGAYRIFCKHPAQPHNLYDPTEEVEKALDTGFDFLGSHFLALWPSVSCFIKWTNNTLVFSEGQAGNDLKSSSL